MKTRASILQYGFEENCRRAIFTPEPQDPAAAYSADVFFDCTPLRAAK